MPFRPCSNKAIVKHNKGGDVKFDFKDLDHYRPMNQDYLVSEIDAPESKIGHIHIPDTQTKMDAMRYGVVAKRGGGIPNVNGDLMELQAEVDDVVAFSKQHTFAGITLGGKVYVIVPESSVMAIFENGQ